MPTLHYPLQMKRGQKFLSELSSEAECHSFLIFPNNKEEGHIYSEFTENLLDLAWCQTGCQRHGDEKGPILAHELRFYNHESSAM